MKISILDKEKLNNNKVFYQIKNNDKTIDKLCSPRKIIEAKSFELKIDIYKLGDE